MDLGESCGSSRLVPQARLELAQYAETLLDLIRDGQCFVEAKEPWLSSLLGEAKRVFSEAKAALI